MDARIAPFIGRSIPFITIVKSPSAGSAEPGQLVIENSQDYTAFFGGRPPKDPPVGFEREEIVAVCMGMQRTGGYKTEIIDVVHAISGFVAGFNIVIYREKEPGRGEVVTHAFTSPAHVVKVERSSRKYIFVKAVG